MHFQCSVNTARSFTLLPMKESLPCCMRKCRDKSEKKKKQIEIKAYTNKTVK